MTFHAIMGDGIMGRRTLLAMGLCLAAPAPLLAQAAPARRPVSFEVWRKGQKIGSHAVSFQGGEQDFNVAIDAEMLVKIGPIPVFHYRHQATETWRGGRFSEFQSRSSSNGHQEHVSAIVAADGVAITTSRGRVLQAPPTTHPLTHWNAAALEAPVFNPQTGSLTHERVSRSAGETVQLANGRTVPATRYSLTGDAEISDWYDGADVWTALHAKAPDGSLIDYRRTA